MPLTDISCRNAKCQAGRPHQRYSDSGGLYLEVSKTGARSWRLKYRYAGREKRLSIGPYPYISLAQARRARDEAKGQLFSGIDPSAAKREARLVLIAQSEMTFEKVARLWWDTWSANKAERHAGYVLKRLESDAFPKIGSRPIGKLITPDFVRMAKAIEARGAIDIARRVLQTSSQIMRYAVAHGMVERSPLGDIKPGDVLKARRQVNFARIELKDLPELLQKIMAYDGSTYTRLAIQLMVLTFVRTGELIGARWKEFDLIKAEWRIPAERTKSRRGHLVPLSKQALQVLTLLQTARGDPQRCQGDFLLFPGERDHSVPMSNNTILFALYRMGYRGRMTGHGFRGVASTALNEMGYRPDVIEAQLAHVPLNRVRAAYNHAQYQQERKSLMQAWADYIDVLKDSANVERLRRPRKRINGQSLAV